MWVATGRIVRFNIWHDDDDDYYDGDDFDMMMTTTTTTTSLHNSRLKTSLCVQIQEHFLQWIWILPFKAHQEPIRPHTVPLATGHVTEFVHEYQHIYFKHICGL